MARIVSPSSSSASGTSTTSGGYLPKSGATDTILYTTPQILTAVTDYGFGNPIQFMPAMSEDVVLFGITEGANNNTTGQNMYSLWYGEMVYFYGPTNPIVDTSGNMVFGASPGSGGSFGGLYKLSATRQLTQLAGSSSTTTPTVDGTGSAVSFNGSLSPVLAPDGNYYVLEQGGGKIRKVTPAGVVTTLAGSGSGTFADGTGTAAGFQSPRTMVYSAYDNCLYVYDAGCYRIRRVTMAGVVTTVVGTGTSQYADGNGTNAGISNAGQVASDGVGGIYFADYQTIRKLDITSASYTVTTIAGAANTTAHADGTGTASARFYNPWGMVYDSINQCLWVHDLGSGSTTQSYIRKVKLPGFVTTSLTPATTTGSNTNGSFDGPSFSAFTMPAAQSPMSIDPTSTWLYIGDPNTNRLRKISVADGRINHVLGHNQATGIVTIANNVTLATRAATVAGVNISSVGKEPWLPFPYPVRVPAGNKVWLSVTNLTSATAITATCSLAWAPISLFQ
jgi:hypothetical protein